MILPYAPSGGADGVTRALAQKLGAAWGRQVVVEAMAGVDLVHIPYKGGGPALTDLLGGQINLIFSTLLGALPHVKSGRLQAIAVSTARRSSVLPNVPTVAESGVPGFESSSWYGVLAPAGTPGEIVAKLNREIVRIVHTPEMRAWIANDGAEAVGSTPAEFAALIKSEIEKWSRVIRTVGIKPE